MSLGLSNLTQFGFQIDLLYFFCGGLTVQLMKIKLWLVTVGGGFSYSLLQLRYYPSDTDGENLRLEDHNQIIIQVNDSESVSSTSHEEANADVDSTQGTSPEDGDLRFQDHLLTQSNSHSQDGSVDDGLIIQQQLMNCIKELEKENHMLVYMVCSHVDKYLKAVFDSKEVPDPDINLVMDALPSEIMRRLKETVKLMVDGGFKEECSDIYNKWRREFLKQCLQKLGLQIELQSEESNEWKIMNWLDTCKVAEKILFPNERKLCDYLFSGFSVAADVSFDKVCEELMIGLLSFVNTTITIGSYLSDLLLDFFPKMSNSLGKLILNFTSETSFVDDIQDVGQRLAMLNNFGLIVYTNNVQAPVTVRGLHLITMEAMDFIHWITKKRVDRSDSIGNFLFWVMIVRMIELLENELVAKYENYYPNPALGHAFMINNLSYIEQKTRDLKLNDDWFRQNAAKVEQYCNVHLRSKSQQANADVDSTLGTSPENLRRMSQQANADVDTSLGTSPEDGDLRFRSYLLIQTSSHSQEDVLIIQQLTNCVKELEKENQMLVPRVCSHVDKYLKAVFDPKEVPDPYINLVMDSLPSEIMRHLKETVMLMVNAGFMEECSDIYIKWRREFLEQCLRALGWQFQTPSNDDFEKWLKTCKAAAKVLFPNEKRLCDYLFSERRFDADVFFEKVYKKLTTGLLSFADVTITTESHLPNLLSNIVPKMLESLHELIGEISAMCFPKLSCVPDLEDFRKKLSILCGLRNTIYTNNVQAPVIHGGLHLITWETMNYILDNSGNIGYSSFWVVIGRMIELLESELEVKSKDYYADPALGYIFMINNLSYIEQKTRDLKFHDDWFRQNTAKVEQKCNLYLRRSWNKMMEFLKVETKEWAEAHVVAELMIENIRLFNLHFEETCTIQSTWTVSDKQLRERIIKSIEGFLLPEYGKFYNSFLVVLGNQADEYIEFGFQDIRNCLSNLFLLDEETNLEYKKNV
ncbi:Exocyst complex component [Vigna angularis]|nr:Exocyst complex component [Vigna angularis]